jgi:hypothetical protein
MNERHLRPQLVREFSANLGCMRSHGLTVYGDEDSSEAHGT